MPSAEIHTWSVLNWRPGCPSLKRARNEIATPSVTRPPTATERPTRRAGNSTPTTTEIASGSQIRIERVTGSRSRARDQEVEGHARQAHDHRGGVVAQEPRLEPAHGGRAG